MISAIICWYTWRHWKIHFSLGSFTIAPIRGRIYFKGLSIYTKERSLIIHRGYVQFRYWINDYASPEINLTPEGILNSQPSFCVRGDGVEIFLFNRSEAYRDLESYVQKNEIILEAPPLLNIFYVWPIELVGGKGSIIIGNPDVAHLLTFSFENMKGLYSHYKISPSTTKIIFKAFLTPAKLFLGVNVDYKEPTLNYAARIRAQKKEPSIWNSLMKVFYGYDDNLDEIPMNQFEWNGLDRYRYWTTGSINAQKTIAEEYAQVSEIAITKMLEFSYILETIGIDHLS